MKISSLTASLLAAALAATVAPAMAQNAAVVNGKAIPSAKVDALIKKSGQPESPELRAKARDMLVDRELIEQDAAGQVTAAGSMRTARKLMDGKVFPAP